MVRIKDVFLVYTLFIMFLPGNVFKMTSFYHVETPAYIGYTAVDYDFSVLLIPIVLYGAYVYYKNFDYRYVVLLILLFANDVIRDMLDIGNFFDVGDYTYYMAFTCGILSAYIFYYGLLEKNVIYFHCFWLANIITQIGNVFWGYSPFEGRWYAINYGLAATGIMSMMGLLMIIFSKERKSRFEMFMIPTYILSMALAGSRSSFVFLLLIICIYEIRNTKISTKDVVKFVLFLICACSVIIVIIMISDKAQSSLSEIIGFYNYLSMIDLQSLNLTSIDERIATESLFGRFYSIYWGIIILMDNPFGLGSSVILIQDGIKTLGGYPSFPHSSFLCYWLLFGVVAWIIIIYGITRLRLLMKEKSKYEMIGWYLFISFWFYGGVPTMNFKAWFMWGCIFLMISNETCLKECDSKVSED